MQLTRVVVLWLGSRRACTPFHESRLWLLLQRRQREVLLLVLQPSLRYAHSRGYIEHLAALNGWQVDRLEAAPLLEEQQLPVMGWYVHLKPALSAGRFEQYNYKTQTHYSKLASVETHGAE